MSSCVRGSSGHAADNSGRANAQESQKGCVSIASRCRDHLPLFRMPPKAKEFSLRRREE